MHSMPSPKGAAMSTGRLAREMARMVKLGKKTPQIGSVAKHGPTRAKYGNVKTVCLQSHKHDSKKEAARCDALTVLWKGGVIDNLFQQPRYEIEVRGHKICTYVADFSYFDNGQRVVEDVKGGPLTAVYRIKKKLLKACHGIDILET